VKKSLLLLLGIAFLLVNTELSAQKVKYKKGQIFLDKELKFEFVEINKEENSSKLKHYVLKDLEGNTILSLRDTAFHYTQLANETSPRTAFEAYEVSVPSKGFKGVMPYIPVMNYAKQRFKDLEKIGFFKSLEFDEDNFNAFLERQGLQVLENNLKEIEDTNANRILNYEKTKEVFGPLLERDPASVSVVININEPNGYLIKEGKGLLVGKFRQMAKGTNNHSFEVINKEGVKIGEVNIFQNPTTVMGLQQYKYNLKPFILGKSNSEENYKWFYDNVGRTGVAKSTNFKLEQIAVYLVNQGMI
jgi:hypothetical protein